MNLIHPSHPSHLNLIVKNTYNVTALIIAFHPSSIASHLDLLFLQARLAAG
jgi:hypothetical protein